jgi:hypothetical protein
MAVERPGSTTMASASGPVQYVRSVPNAPPIGATKIANGVTSPPG